MKKIILILLTFTSILSCKRESATEIIVIGTQQKSGPNFNPEILFNILESVKPDFILLELDSTKFTSDFRSKQTSKENEYLAAEKYHVKYPTTQLRPYEFEGLNQYMINKGIQPTGGLTLELLDSLYKTDLLGPGDTKKFKTYKDLLESLSILATKSPENFNNATTDSICEERFFYQYKMIPRTTNTLEEFRIRFVAKPNGEKIDYGAGYQLWANFWGLRNATKAKNIMTISEQNKGKKIVVLCGFTHRYYIIKKLKRLTKDKNIELKEYYEK